LLAVLQRQLHLQLHQLPLQQLLRCQCLLLLPLLLAARLLLLL
jgi:hypothetical protein